MFQDLFNELRGEIVCRFFSYQTLFSILNALPSEYKLRWHKSDFVSVSKAHTKCVLSLLLDEPVPLNDK